MARILFLYPSLISGWASYVKHGNNESSYADVGFMMLSAVLKREGHDCFSMDLRSFQGWEHFEQTLKLQTFDLTLVTFYSANEIFARQAVEIVKRNFPDKYIIGGGVHLSVTKTREYPNIDTIVWGEGEPHILNIVETIQSGKAPKKLYELKMIENMDALPYADRELFNREMEETSPLVAGLPEPFITIVAGRGCYGRCTFCFPTRNLINGNKCRIRSVDHFLGEIIQLNNEKPIGSLMIHDDLLGTKKWMEEFIEKWHFNNLPRIPFWCQLRADTILRIKDYIPALSEIGLQFTSIGLESGSQRMLDFLKKGTTVEQNIEACKLLHANDINVFGNFISGLPTETEEDILGTEKMLSIIKPAFLAHSIYTSYPGSYLYDWIKQNNYWVGEDENDPKNHYSMHRFPFERKIKGVDYERIFRLQAEYNAKYKGELRAYTPKPKTYISKEKHNQTQTKSLQTNRPKASVILVTYKRPEMFEKAVRSIFNQTLEDWELIIIDNNDSSDVNRSVFDWINSTKYKDRVRVITHAKNINNIAYCWNEGLDIIRGDYWCTLDDDNTKYPEYLNKMVAYLEQHPEKEAVICAMQHTGETQGYHFEKPKDFTQLKTGNRIDSGQVVYRRRIIEKIGVFDENLVSYEDWDYILRVYSLNNYSGSAFGWLDGVPPLCSYHWHKQKRMYDKGIISTYTNTETRVRNKQLNHKFRVMFYEPGGNGRTESQKQLSGNILEALRSLTEVVQIVKENPDLIILSGTLYNMSLEDLQNLKNSNPQAQIVALLCEDPQALHVNIRYTPYIDWLVSNDINAFSYYIDRENDPKKKAQILHWNNLSISNKLLEFVQSYNPEKEYDVCMVGYAYESRLKFLEELRPMIPNRKLLIIGDTWKTYKINPKPEFFSPTLDEIGTAKLAMKSKIILIKHRDNTDIGGFPIVAPLSVNRGYIEAAYKSVLMIDNRPEHSFGGSVITYTNEVDCANWINLILKEYDSFKPRIDNLYLLAIERFTMRERLLKVLNCIRSPRYNKKIE